MVKRPKWLYHITRKEYLDNILKNGLDNKAEFRFSKTGETQAEKARDNLEHHFPVQKDAVFFFKIPIKTLNREETVLKIRAKDIPCKCIEGDKTYSDAVFDSYMFEEHVEMEDIKKYEKSLRILDNKKNPYPTEVMCKCKIPAKIIKVS